MLGPNGAGKTLHVSVIATQLRPTAGDALVFGRSVSDVRRRRVGVVPEIRCIPADGGQNAVLRPCTASKAGS